jgi:Flp pilus assembly protein TadD
MANVSTSGRPSGLRAMAPMIVALLMSVMFAACAPLPVQELPRPDSREREAPTERGLPPQLPPQPPPPTDRTPPPPRPLPTPVPAPAPDPVPGYHPASEALVEQARREALLGDQARAGATLERALRIDADNPWIWIELGHLRLEAGHVAAAQSMARKALSLSSRDTGAREAAGQLLQQAGSGP